MLAGVVSASGRGDFRSGHSSHSGVFRAVVIACMSLLAAGMASAQSDTSVQVSLMGIVRDVNGSALSGAIVTAPNGAVRVTDDSGSFRIDGLARGASRFEIRRLGYAPYTFTVTLTHAVTSAAGIKLHPIPVQLEEVAVAADTSDEPAREGRFRETGFFERRRRLAGYFFTPEDVTRINPDSPSDVLRGVSGISIVGRTRTGTARFMSQRDRCRMNVFVDGDLLTEAGDDIVRGADIKAVEVYMSPLQTPIQFSRNGSKSMCGTIVIWTK